MLALLGSLMFTPASAVDVEVRYEGLSMTYRVDAGDVIEHIWEEVPPHDGRGPQKRWPDLRVRVTAEESAGGLLVTVGLDELHGDEVVRQAWPTLIVSEEAPRAHFSVASNVPVRTHQDGQTVVRFARQAKLEVDVFPEGERGDQVVEPDDV